MRIADAIAKARSSELLPRVEEGGQIELTRYSQLPACIIAAGPPAQDGSTEMVADFEDLLDGFTEAMIAPTKPPA